MSERCYKCFKPASNCLCRFTKELDPGVKFLFLMHPKEAKRNRTGTGQLAHISLKSSEIIQGLDFSQNTRLQELLHDPKYFPMMMYPGVDAWNAKKEGFKEAVGDRIPLIIILDATWFCAKKMIEHNPFLLEYPRLSFFGDYRSIFTFKHEPRPEYISTIESCYYMIKELQTCGLADTSVDPEPLMNVFKEMIKFQLTAENERIMGLRPSTHHYDEKYTKLREIPEF
ncbi:MAG: DTW domain-containing protein [Treponema sp.]|nr:DTW domain-containing protein [Treponema sp.]